MKIEILILFVDNDGNKKTLNRSEFDLSDYVPPTKENRFKVTYYNYPIKTSNDSSKLPMDIAIDPNLPDDTIILATKGALEVPSRERIEEVKATLHRQLQLKYQEGIEKEDLELRRVIANKKIDHALSNGMQNCVDQKFIDYVALKLSPEEIKEYCKEVKDGSDPD